MYVCVFLREKGAKVDNHKKTKMLRKGDDDAPFEGVVSAALPIGEEAGPRARCVQCFRFAYSIRNIGAEDEIVSNNSFLDGGKSIINGMKLDFLHDSVT